MRILTLDLSTKQSGYAIGTEKQLQSHGYFSFNHKDVEKRIIQMRDSISNLIKKNQINKIVTEEVRPEYNSHTMKVLMWMQAAIILAVYEINPKIQYEFIGASSWRAELKIKQGKGIKREQLKPQDIDYVKNKYNIDVNDDQADAICIFDAYWLKQNNEINWE